MTSIHNGLFLHVVMHSVTSIPHLLQIQYAVHLLQQEMSSLFDDMHMLEVEPVFCQVYHKPS